MKLVMTTSIHIGDKKFSDFYRYDFKLSLYSNHVFYS